MSREEGRRQRSRRKNRQKKIGVFLSVAVLSAAAAAIAVSDFPAPIQASIRSRMDLQADKDARDGLLSTETRPVAKGEYRVVLNQLPTMKQGSRDCNIEFENPAENHYSSRISLYLKSTGAHLGGSRRIEPGQYLETVELSEALDPGETPVLAEIELFDGTEQAGTITLELTIRVTT